MLNDKQEAAIDLLVAGRKGVDIEKEVGVSHAQLYRWRHDPEFVARWEDARAQVHEQRAEKLFEVGSRAWMLRWPPWRKETRSSPLPLGR